MWRTEVKWRTKKTKQFPQKIKNFHRIIRILLLDIFILQSVKSQWFDVNEWFIYYKQNLVIIWITSTLCHNIYNTSKHFFLYRFFSYRYGTLFYNDISWNFLNIKETHYTTTIIPILYFCCCTFIKCNATLFYVVLGFPLTIHIKWNKYMYIYSWIQLRRKTFS